MGSHLGDYTVEIAPSCLQPALSVDEHFARDIRHRWIVRRPAKRAEYEAAMATDRATIEAIMQPGDELRPFLHLIHPEVFSGARGVAIVRSGRVVKAWWTQLLC